jgi:ABC-2 type transport system permease protein
MPSSLHNTWLIAKREYLERVRTKAFLIATVLIPILMGGFVFASGYLGTKTKSIAHVAVVSADPQFTADLKNLLETGKRSHMTVDTYTPSPATRTALDEDLKNKNGITGYLWVTPSPAAGKRPAFAYVARSAGDATTVNILNNSIQTALTREELTRTGVASKDIDNLLAPVDIDTSATGNSKAAYSAALVLFLLMYMVIMLYGMNTARSIIEEKTSRVFEVLLATIKPEEMLAGKILGVGAVGLTQIGVWMLAAIILGSTGLAASMLGSGKLPISLGQALFFVVYFLFGFLVYSSIAAALGAMTNSEQELQQLNMFLVLPLAFCMLMLFVIGAAPNSTLSTIVSLIPFCSPLLMNLRISLTTVPGWQIALSFVLMSLTILAILWVASRIYRVGILMYGKKPNLPEILRWLKYS